MRRPMGRGAILADVVIAAFVLSVGLLAVVVLFMQVAQAGKVLARHEQAACMALEELEQYRNLAAEEGSAECLSSLVGHKQITKGGVVFERVTSYSLRTDLDSRGHLAELSVRVDWQEGNNLLHYSLVTYFVVDTELENLR